LTISLPDQSQIESTPITKNDMTVKWSSDHENISFQMIAPTNGWIAIGFNEKSELTGTYLIMGAITKSGVLVQQHYVSKPGKYKSFATLNEPESISKVSGSRSSKLSTI